MLLGYNTNGLAHHDLLDAITLLAEIGYQGVAITLDHGALNPYDADECAAALQAALEMPEKEQRARMRLMRSLIEEFNVFRWAGRIMLDAAGVRRRSRLDQRYAIPLRLHGSRPHGGTRAS